MKYTKSLHYKLIYPDYILEKHIQMGKFFQNGNISNFLDLATKYRKKKLIIYEFINSIRGSYRYLTNFNFIKI